MNNKGFTLVELLATIVILGIIMGIATYGVINAIKTSKLKSEKVFVDKIEIAVQGYLSYYGKDLKEKRTLSNKLKRCRTDNSDCEYVTITELESINLSTITQVELKTLNINDLVNPKNKKQCVDENFDPTIRILKDEKSVYYYIIDLSGNNTACEISEENELVSNIMPYIDHYMCSELGGESVKYVYNGTEKGCELNKGEH